MSLRYRFGAHNPLLTSIVRRAHGYAALCESCSMPLERNDDGRWEASEPLVSSHPIKLP